jgi:hypothetical protein
VRQNRFDETSAELGITSPEAAEEFDLALFCGYAAFVECGGRKYRVTNLKEEIPGKLT